MYSHKRCSFKENHGIAQKYFFQYLHAFVHENLQPLIPTALAWPYLSYYIEKHHLNFIFRPLFKTHATVVPSLMEDSVVKVKQYLGMIAGMRELVITFQKQNIGLL